MKVFLCVYVIEENWKQNILNCQLHLGRPELLPLGEPEEEKNIGPVSGDRQPGREGEAHSKNQSVEGRGWGRESRGSWRM